MWIVQMIHMKCQALFSLKNNLRYNNNNNLEIGLLQFRLVIDYIYWAYFATSVFLQ